MTEQHIAADLLIPGRGAPVPDARLVLADGRIAFAGPDALAPPISGDLLRIPVVMPGMWDVHTHLVGSIGGIAMDNLLLTPPAVAGARSVGDLSAALRAGFTSVRELGGHGAELAALVADGTLPGPAVYAAGAPISPSGGHADAHRLPYDFVHERQFGAAVLHMADGVPECLRAVRLQLRRGAAVIKVCASGGVLSDLDHPVHQQFSAEELAAVVAEAARADRVVAAHCHGKPGIVAALRAGCRTIEHGSHLDAETARMMADLDAILVPTRSIYEGILGMRHAVPPGSFRKAEEMAHRHEESVGYALAAGVRIASGSDLGTSTPGTALSWGANGAEPGHLVRLGLSPLAAIEACTATAPATLGPQAPRSGLLAEGYDADVLGLTADPVAEIGVLADPARISHVWRAGVLVKRPPREVDLNPA